MYVQVMLIPWMINCRNDAVRLSLRLGVEAIGDATSTGVEWTCEIQGQC